MAISKEKKLELLKEYSDAISATNGVVVVQQSGVSVNDMTDIRKNLLSTGAKFIVVRKRLFLRAVKEAGLQDVGIGDLEGAIAILFNGEDDMSPLKVINNAAKLLKKEKTGSLKFLGAWYDKDWKDGDYISELANVPAKEELLSKLVYLLNYPVQSFAATLNSIAEKNGGGEDVKEEVKEETKSEEVKEEIKSEEVKEEIKSEEVKEEATEAVEAEKAE